MQRFRNILVIVDEGSAPKALMSRAEWLARANGAALTLVDVIDAAPGELSRLFAALPGTRAHEVEDQVVNLRRDRLEDLAAPLRAAGHRVETRVLQGVGFVEIIRHVLAQGNDLVLKTALHGPERAALRGPDLHLLRKCPCPVWILNSQAEPASRRIMAAVDPDPADPVRNGLARMVMELSTSLARQDGARVDVVCAWHLQEEGTLRHGRAKIPESEIEAIIANTKEKSAANLQTLMADFDRFSDITRVLHVKGPPEDVLTAHAESERIDTLVMGTVARTGIAGLLIGNTAETVLNRVGCSVLTVKPRGFLSPVTLEEDQTE